jgi:hypothetical protein
MDVRPGVRRPVRSFVVAPPTVTAADLPGGATNNEKRAAFVPTVPPALLEQRDHRDQ